MACETWNHKLKSGAGLAKWQEASHGIYGMVLNIMDASNDVDSRVDIAKSLSEIASLLLKST